MYTLGDYLAMIADRRRTRAHLDAMRVVIRPGDVVLELGTGFGYFAVQAALMGAGHVYAVEPLDAVALGPAFAAANGVADRVTFLPLVSTRAELPQRATVLIEDLRGASPLFTRRLTALLDARARLLAPGARVIPCRDRLQLTCATAPEALDRDERALARESHGVNLDAVLAHARVGWRRVNATEATPLAPTVTWAELDYARFTSVNVAGTAVAEVDTAGRLDGFVSSFEAELAPGITYATAPDAGRMVYDAAWFPLEEPMDVLPGDTVTVRMRAAHDGADYVWAWDTTVRAGDGRFTDVTRRQTNLADLLRSPARLRRRDAAFVPVPSAATALRSEALALADGHRPLAEIAAALHAHHPAAFADAHAALRWTADWLAELEESGPP